MSRTRAHRPQPAQAPKAPTPQAQPAQATQAQIARSRAQARPSRRKGPQDFSDEYSGLKVSVVVEGGRELVGRVLASSKYWLKLLLDQGEPQEPPTPRVLYINKAHVILVEPLEEAPPTKA